MTPALHDDRILPARTHAHVRRWFRAMVGRMVRRSFNGVRLSRESASALGAFEDRSRPLIVALNHQSWWDPIVGLVLSGALCPERPGLAPMDRQMLERFGIFRRVGVFGLDPDDPESLPAMRTYVGGFLREHADGVLWLTPQGEFADPRTRVRIRPGAAAIAVDTPEVRVVSVAIEYPFWLDKRPEILLHASEVASPDRPSVGSWHRALSRAMQGDNERLQALAVARDPGAFRPLLASKRGGTSPVYNAWLRLRGKRTDLASERTSRPNTREAPVTGGPGDGSVK